MSRESQFFKPLHSEAGITLVELMLVVLISGMVLVMAVGLLLNTSGTSNTFTQGLDVEIEEIAAVTAFQNLVGQATQLRSAGSADLNTWSSPDGTGMIREFDSDQSFGESPSAHTLAVFWRDQQNSSLTPPLNISSNFSPTAIYFQKPTVTTYGVLYMNLGGGGGGALAPSRSDLIFEGITRLRIRNMSTFRETASTPAGSGPVTSFDVEISFRRFVGDVKGESKTYCPESKVQTVSGCNNLGAHRDVTRTFRVLAKNNILMMSANGGRGARLYDLIHFFGLGKSGALR